MRHERPRTCAGCGERLDAETPSQRLCAACQEASLRLDSSEDRQAARLALSAYFPATRMKGDFDA